MDEFVSNRAFGETSQCPEDMTAEEALAEESRQAVTEVTRQQLVATASPSPQPEWSHTSGTRIVIQNVVATANLRIAIDLKTLATSARNAEYNPKKFAAVIMRLREPRCTGLIFSTGKMVCTGAKSEHESRMGARKFAAVLDKIGWNPKFTEFTIQNMVATADVNFPIRLEQLVYSHSKFCSYEPELFPGCIYRLVVPKTVILLFVSGRMVITGAKSVSHLQTAFDKIFPVLLQFKKTTQRYDQIQAAKSSTNNNTDQQRLVETTAQSSTLAVDPPPTTTVASNSTSSNSTQAPRRRLQGAPQIRSARRPKESPTTLPTIHASDSEEEEEEDDDDDDDDEAMPEAMPDEIDEGEDEPEEEDKEDEAMPEAMPNEFDEGEDEPEEEVEEDEAISEAMPDEDEEAEDESEEEDEAMPNEIDEEDEAMPNEIDEEDEAMPNEIDEEDEAMPNEIDEELYGQEQEEYEPDEDEEAEDEPDEEDPASNTALSQEEGAEAEKHSRKHRKSLGLLNGGAAVAAASNSQTNPTKPKSSPRSSSQQKSKASQKRQELFKATEVFLGQKKQDAINNQIDAMTDLLRTRLQNANFQQRKTALKSLVSLVAEVGTVSTVEQAISCFDRSVATNQRGATNQRVATTQMTVVSSRSRAEVTMTPRDEVAFSMALPTSWLVVEDNLDTIKRSLQACLHPEIYSELEPRLRSSSILCCRVFAHGFIQPWTVTGKSPIAIDTNDDGLFYVGQTRLELNAEIGNYDGKQLGPEAAFSYRPSGHYVMSQVCCPKVEEWTSEIQSAWENSDDNNPLIPIDLYVDGNGGVCGAMYKMNDGQHNLIPIAQRQTNNVKLCEDGLCRAIQEVTPGTELTTSYNLDKSPRTRAKRRKRLSTITTRNSRQKQPAMAQSDDERSDITQTNNDLSRRMELAQDSESKDADEQNLGSTADNEAQQMTEDVDMDNEVDDQSSDNLEEEPAPKRSRHSIPAKTVVNNNSGTEDVDISLEASDDNGVSPAVRFRFLFQIFFGK